SRSAGRALMDLVAARAEPIPFFAEMSSTNPVFVLPGALHDRSDAIATGLHTSFTLGAGQFCTKPGVIFLPEQNEVPEFVSRLQALVSDAAPFHPLTKTIKSSYHSGLPTRYATHNVKPLAPTDAPQ